MAFNKYLKSSDFLIGASEASSKIAAFIIIPISGLVLTTMEFNLWTIIFPSVQVLSTAFSFGLPSYLLKSYYTYNKEDRSYLEQQIYSSFLILLVFSGIAVSVSLAFGVYLSTQRLQVVLIIITSSFLLIIQQKYQAEKRGWPYLIQSFIWRNCFAAILLIFFILRAKTTLDFLLIAMLIIQVGLCIQAIFAESIKFKIKFDPDVQKTIFRFGFPLFLIGMFQYMVSINSRLFIYNQGHSSDTAVFSIIQTFVGGLNLLFVIFVRIYVPKLYSVLNFSESPAILDRYSRIMRSLFAIISICVILALFVYSQIFEKSFDKEIIMIAPVLILGQFFYGIQIFVVDSIVFKGDTVKLMILNGLVTVFSTVAGYFFVRYFGLIGGAISVFLSQLFSLMLVLFITNDLFRRILGYKFLLISFAKLLCLLVTLLIFYFLLGKTATNILLLSLLGLIIWNFASFFKTSVINTVHFNIKNKLND
jgi:O-antigen/teichoic acid export membrane protein